MRSLASWNYILMNDIKTIIKSDEWTVNTTESASCLMKWSNHCGWCTKTEGIAKNYLNGGKIYSFVRKGNRKTRPSYQLYVSDRGINIEFKKKGDISAKLNIFLLTRA